MEARCAEFGSGVLPVEVLVITRPSGGWHVTGVLYRVSDGLPQLHERWPERWTSDPETIHLDQEWRYLAGRVHDGSGGNYYSYEVEGFDTTSVAAIDPIVTAREAEIVVSRLGPLGEATGTLNDGYDTYNFASMPFVVLPDDRGYVALVATDAAKGLDCTVTPAGGQPRTIVPFKSVEHWQRSGVRSWRTEPGAVHMVSWGNASVQLVVASDATLIAMDNLTRSIDEVHDE